MEHNCIHEADLARTNAKVEGLQHQVNKINKEIGDLKEHNTTIVELSISLKNLISKVSELCELMQGYDLRIDILERAEGEALKELKKALQFEITKKIATNMFLIISAVIAGKYLI